MYKLALLISFSAYLLIFVFVPLSLMSLGLDGVVFHREPLTHSVIANLTIAISLPFIIFYSFIPSKKLMIQNNSDINSNFTYFLLMIIIFWMLAFTIGGGLDYRQNDVSSGVVSRSVVLRVIFLLNGVVSIISIYLLYAKNGSVFKDFLSYFVVVSFLALNAFAGSRGFVVQIIMSMTIVHVLKISSQNMVRKKIFVINIRKILQNSRIFLQGIMLSIIVLGVIAYWGAQRDGYNDILFSLMFRLSEPYWHFSYLEWRENGGNITILSDSLSRIMYIIGRLFGMRIDGTIDGSDYYLDKFLNIRFMEGVSLPITLVGHGFLINGYQGVAFTIVASLSMLVISIRIVTLFARYYGSLCAYIIAYQLSKSFFLYSKSLSGAFLYIGYELFRDLIILSLIFGMYRGLQYASNTR